jgi:hypothetical protein
MTEPEQPTELTMSPHYHGLSVADAAVWSGFSEVTIRRWLADGKVQRTPDGQVDYFSLRDWAWVKRDQGKAKRTGIHAAGQPRWDRKRAG